jgi:hypothetical protein
MVQGQATKAEQDVLAHKIYRNGLVMSRHVVKVECMTAQFTTGRSRLIAYLNTACPFPKHRHEALSKACLHQELEASLVW